MKTAELKRNGLIELDSFEMKEVNGGIAEINIPSPIIIEDFAPALKW